MSTDPFLIVKEEVIKSLAIAEKQLKKVKVSHGDGKNIAELSNTLKSISWDLEDLEETVSIVEKDPHKFPVAFDELASRKAFVEATKSKLGDLRARVSALQEQEGPHVRISKAHARLTTINIDDDEVKSPRNDHYDQIRSQQELLLKSQDHQLDQLGNSVNVLKNISQKMNDELDDQAILLDDVSQEMDKTESRMDASMKKMARLLHLTSDRRQWCAIVILVVIIVILIVLLTALPDSK